MAVASPAPSLPKRVLALFRRTARSSQGREWLSLPELAEAFEISERTMRKHLSNGTLPSHRFGAGNERIHRRFTLADAKVFWSRVSPES